MLGPSVASCVKKVPISFQFPLELRWLYMRIPACRYSFTWHLVGSFANITAHPQAWGALSIAARRWSLWMKNRWAEEPFFPLSGTVNPSHSADFLTKALAHFPSTRSIDFSRSQESWCSPRPEARPIVRSNGRPATPTFERSPSPDARSRSESTHTENAVERSAETTRGIILNSHLLHSISSLRFLTELFLDASTLFDDDIGILSAPEKMPGLMKLGLTSCLQLTDKTPALISTATYAPILRHFTLQGCVAPLSTGLTTLIDRARGCIELDFAGCHSIEPSVFRTMLSSLRWSLRSLSLLELHIFDAEALSVVFQFPLLTALDVSCCPSLDVSGVCSFSSRPPIENLAIRGYTSLNSDMLFSMLKDFRDLARLDVSKTMVADDAIIAAISSCPLRELLVDECPNITDVTVLRIADLLGETSDLRFVSVVDCPNTSLSCLSHVKQLGYVLSASSFAIRF